MKYFENCKNREELKETYKDLVKKFHPDIYGEKGNDIMKEIHNQLEKAVRTIDKTYMNKFNNTDKEESHETRTKKEQLAKEAMKYKNPEFYLFAMYWHENLTPSNHRNPLTKHNFSGGNIWTLELKMLLQGYKSAEWSTFAQYKANKNSIKKGEHGTYITLAIVAKPKDENEDEKTKVYYKGYTVFNAEQTKNGANGGKPAQITEIKAIEMKEPEQKTLNLWDSVAVVA